MPQSVLKPVSTGLCDDSSHFGGYEYVSHWTKIEPAVVSAAPVQSDIRVPVRWYNVSS
jgi:hypothetical protein